MKNLKNIVWFVGVLLGLYACGEIERGQYATDKVPPGQVSNVQVENIAGGAIITYTVPDDDDLLYVKAVYKMSDGTRAEQKSSTTNPRIVVEGLGRSQKQTIQLICGDRSSNESAPYSVEIEPLDAAIYAILESVEIFEDYGGIRITWDNPLKASIVLTSYILDEASGTYLEIENVYSASPEGKYNVRGFPATKRTFAVGIRDRWNNKTDRRSGEYTPYFEEKLDRLKFGRWNPPGIPYVQLDNDWSLERLWDGLLANPGWSSNHSTALPMSITFNLGQTALLNRIKVFQRTTGDQLFTGYNTKKFQLWASPTPNVTADFATWLYMGEFTSVKPSGLPLGQLTEEDIAYGAAGEDYVVEENRDIPVQYIRIHIFETHGGSNVAQFFELEFYGRIIQ